MRHRTWILVLSLGFLGCGSTPDDGPKEVTEVTVHLKPPPNQTAEVRDFEHEWEDLTRDDKGIVSYYEKALWINERHDEAMRLMRLEPPARLQACQILEGVLRRDPLVSKTRFVLARIQFLEAAYWYRAVDHWGYYMTWLIEKRYLPEDPERTLSDQELDEALAKVRPKIKEGNRFLRKAAEASLRNFVRYHEQRPDEEQVLDYVWKLHVYLQNYRDALGQLEHLLDLWARRDVSDKNPAVVNYEAIRGQLERYLTLVEVEGAKGRDPLPWRAKERSLLSGTAPGAEGSSDGSEGVSSPPRDKD